ncbi:dihydrofolate reductase family protein [Microbacterium allomyrinae]|jgi:dihydrofolate reductase|uniref:Dihydrofolate reductase family protein n=1 Tax=Microbacterium allomyrinae TaxID=2830666 RepID=A0A9X1S481_9MICO|nr:dihydrofolate reductase family protein [Microbacterium allomyrinae]MCC2033959.1 dihydrofolate reductase family protein [Microbacterium allomyrinae]
MGKVITSASASLDGFVAHENNDPGRLFDWYEAGDVEVVTASEPAAFHLTRTSADYWQSWVGDVGCLVVGRLLFDITDGWQGEHPMGVPFVVLTHEVPTEWAHAHTGNAHFVTEGIEAAIARAQEIAGDRVVGVAAGTIAGQALAAGLVDEVAIDLVPVVLGTGHRYFEGVDPAAVRLGDPTVVIQSARVTHMVFPVER